MAQIELTQEQTKLLILARLGNCGYNGRDMYYTFDHEIYNVSGAVPPNSLMYVTCKGILERMEFEINKGNLQIAEDCFNIKCK